MSANIRNEPGAPASGDAIPLCTPVLAGNEWAYVKECLDTNWISSVGPFVTRFEKEIALRVGTRHAVAVVNGTAALHLALEVVGVAPGDEVVIPALTFIATANAVRYAGAVPAILDVESDYWQLDPEALRRFLEQGCSMVDGRLVNRATGRRIGAIVPVHVLGHPADMDQILGLAERFGVPVVEDAAESLGATYKGKPTGGFGRIGCISFNGNKTITCGGGGMLVTDDDQLAARARYLSTQAKDDDLAYVHNEIGYNYRMTNVLAAIGVAQLERLDHCIGRKRDIAAIYAQELAGLGGLSFMRESPDVFSTFWLSTVRIDAAEFGVSSGEVLARMNQARIQTRPLWQPMHRSPAHRDAYVGEIRVADWVHAQALSLPSSVDLTAEQQARVIDVFRSCRA